MRFRSKQNVISRGLYLAPSL